MLSSVGKKIMFLNSYHAQKKKKISRQTRKLEIFYYLLYSRKKKCIKYSRIRILCLVCELLLFKLNQYNSQFLLFVFFVFFCVPNSSMFNCFENCNLCRCTDSQIHRRRKENVNDMNFEIFFLMFYRAGKWRRDFRYKFYK